MRSPRDLLVVAVATPLVFPPVAVGLRWLATAAGVVSGGVPPSSVLLAQLGAVDVVRYVAVTGTLAAGGVATADRGVYAPGVLAMVSLAAIAVLSPADFFQTGALGTIAFVLVLLAGGAEWLARSRFGTRDAPEDRAASFALGLGLLRVDVRVPTALATDEDVHLALALGLLHAALAMAASALQGSLWALLRPVALPLLALLAAGVGALWAVPVLAYRREGLVAPAAVAGGWSLWGGALYVRNLPDLPLAQFVGWSPFALDPYPGYLWKWTLPLALVLYAGLVEWAARGRGLREQPPSELRDGS